MKKPEFSARIAELAEAAAQGAVMAAREVLMELSRIGRANMADFVRAFFGCGDPVAVVDQLTPAQTAALAEVTVEQFMDCRGEHAREVRRIRFKLVNKIDALELLGKHHKLYTDRIEHDWRAGLAERLAAALARVHGQERGDPAYHGRRDPPRGGASGRPQHARKGARKGQHARA
jgi:hypothetical protein